MILTFLLLTVMGPSAEEGTFASRVFGHERHYRLFLPADYAGGTKRYPVIYYFHGHSDRYTLERYDEGKDTVPKIERFVRENGVIVVAVDGYVAEHYTGFYGGAPYDLYADGGRYDFGEYFLEMVAHIDGRLRTLADRRHRATSGLSMGGYLSLYLSARYPDVVGSASAFNPGPEFYAGEAGRRVLWRPKDHVSNHTRTMVRLVRASGDYISQYHEESRMAYARDARVEFEYRQDEYHRHWATSIGETFGFHARAFENAALDERPESFDHDSAQARFEVWGWAVETRGGGAGYTEMRGVRRGGLRVVTRRWAPDGPEVKGRWIEIRTPGQYRAGAEYDVLDAPLGVGEARRMRVRADGAGRLRFVVDGTGRQVSIRGADVRAQGAVVLPVARAGVWRVVPGVETAVPVRIHNPRETAMRGVSVTVESEYPTVEVLAAKAEVEEIAAGGSVDLSSRLRVRFQAGGGDYAAARMRVTVVAGGESAAEDVDVTIAPDGLTAPDGVEVLDGRTVTLRVFRQKGNQGGGGSVERRVSEGKGNGNGVLEPGEEATVWVKTGQGLDPFDKGNWYRARVYSESPWLEEVDRLEEKKQLEWTGAQELTSVIRLDGGAPAGTVIPVVLRNESWSFHFTPDVRYGAERLYQAYQLHRGHVWRWTVRVGEK